MIFRSIPVALLLLAPIGVASAQGGQRAHTEAAQPVRPTSALPISSDVPAGLDSAKALNAHLSVHPKRKKAANARVAKKAAAAAATRPSNDSVTRPAPPPVRPAAKPAPAARPPKQ